MNKKINFRLPGPIELIPPVYKAMSKPMINHKGPEFQEIFLRVVENLKYVFQTQNDLIVLNCSGKGALESVVANFFRSDSTVLVLSNGFFGDNLVETTKTYCSVVPLPCTLDEFEWNEPITPEIVEKALKRWPNVEAVYVVHSETSTGLLNPIKEIGKVVKSFNKLFMVDAVSSLGGADIKPDEWGIDVLVTGSQKALGAAPGLSFVSVSPEAWKAYKRAELSGKALPKRYWDYEHLLSHQKDGIPASTPNITVFYGLDVSLQTIRDEGLDEVFDKHRTISRRTWELLESYGLEIFVEDKEYRSPTVTAIKVPEGIDAKILSRHLIERYNVELVGGLGKLAGKIVRIGHMGPALHGDPVLGACSALRDAVDDLTPR